MEIHMLTLIEGGFFSGVEDILKESLSEDCKKHIRAFYVVPEQQTVSSEREFTELLAPDYPLYAEITNFTRLANTVFRELGGLAQGEADSLKRSLMIYQAIGELRPYLRTVGGGAVSCGTVNKTISAIRKMQSLSLSTEELDEVSRGLSENPLSARLCDKLHDLSKIITVYNELLRKGYGAAEDTLTKLKDKLKSDGERVFSGAHVYIEGFTSFTEPQYAVISELVRLSDVTVALTLPRNAGDAFEYTELRTAHDRLVRLAATAGVEVKLRRLDDGEAPVPLLQELCGKIWRSNGEFDNSYLQNTGVLRIFEADNPYEECDFIAADIKKKVMAGARYSDFAVLARSQDVYSGILSVSFEKAGIPLFVSESDSIASFEIMKLITSALASISSDFARGDVTCFAKCSLSPITDEESDEFELYIQRWQLDGARFTDDEDWLMNPDGFDSRKDRNLGQRLDRINGIRRRLIQPLCELRDEFKASGCVRSRTAALFSFLARLDSERKLMEKAAELRALGRTRDAEGCERIYPLVIDTLEAIVEVLGDCEATDDGFINILNLAFAEAKLGRIPSFTEQVVAGSVDTARFFGKKHIYLIGANLGVLPMRINDDGFFQESELNTLMNSGLRIEPDLTKRSAMEYFYISRALSFCTESLTVLYPAYDASFSPLRRSELVERITEMTNTCYKPIKISSIPLSDRIYTEHYALEHLADDAALRPAIESALDGVGLSDYVSRAELPIKNVHGRLSESSLSLLYKDTLAMTQSRLDSYSACPMRYFLNSSVGLDEGERANFGANNIGTFIHAVLEYFFRELKQRGTEISSLTKEERIALTKDAARRYTKECFSDTPTHSKRIDALVSRLSRHALPIVDGLCDEFSACKYEPTFFELKIDKNNPNSPAPVVFKASDGRDIYVYGTIDRVDTYKSGDKVYVRVVDYKTGRKSFSPSDLERGENLQMFLYLKSIVDSDSPDFKAAIGAKPEDELIPAGVIYVKTDVSEVSVVAGDSPEEKIKKKQARLGMLLDETESIEAMNPAFIPIKYKKDGTPDKSSQDKLYSISQWGELSETLENSVRRICDSVLSGDVSALPLKRGGESSTCQYCRFKAVCRNSSVF